MPNNICCMFRQPSDSSNTDPLSSQPPKASLLDEFEPSFKGSCDVKVSGKSQLGQILVACKDIEDQERDSVLPTEMTKSQRFPMRTLHRTTSRLLTILCQHFSRDATWSSKDAWRKARPTLGEEEAPRRRGSTGLKQKYAPKERLEDHFTSRGNFGVETAEISAPILARQRSCGAIRMSSNKLSDWFRRFRSTCSDASLDDAMLGAKGFERMPLHLPFENSTSIWDNGYSGIDTLYEDFFRKPEDTVENGATRIDSGLGSLTSDFEGTSGEADEEPASTRNHTVTDLQAMNDFKGPHAQNLDPARLASLCASIQQSWRLSSSRSRRESMVMVRGSGHHDQTTAEHGNRLDTLQRVAGRAGGLGAASSPPFLKYQSFHQPSSESSQFDPAAADACFGGADGSTDLREQSKIPLGGDYNDDIRFRRDDGLVTDIILPEQDIARCLYPTLSLADLANGSVLQAAINESSLRKLDESIASSVYSIQSPGSAESTNTSMARLGHIAERMKSLRGSDCRLITSVQSQGSNDASKMTAMVADELDSHRIRRHPIDMASLQSTSESLRGIFQLDAAEGAAKSPRGENAPKMSRFKEDFGNKLIRPPMIEESSTVDPNSPRKAHRNDNRLYNHRQGQEDSMMTWDSETSERASRTYDDYSRLRFRRSMSSGSRCSDRCPGRSKPGSMDMGSSRSLAAPQKSRIFDTDTGFTRGWGVWPSHPREQPSQLPPSELDGGRSHYSAPKFNTPRRTKSQSMILEDRKLTRSMTLGRKLLRSLGRKSPSGSPSSSLRNSSSLDPPLTQLVEPALTRPSPISPLLPFVADQKKTDDLDQIGVEIQYRKASLNASSRGAKAWSKIYEECVARPTDSEAISLPTTSVELLDSKSRLSTYSCSWKSSVQYEMASISSPQELRKSSSCPVVGASEGTITLEDLRHEEEKARQHLLAVVEEVWGP